MVSAEGTAQSGVCCLDLQRAGAEQILAEAEGWLRAAEADGRRRRLWGGRHSRLLQLVAAGQTRQLDADWILGGLGMRKGLDPAVLDRSRILRWTGAHQPFTDHGLYVKTWLPYRAAGDCPR